MTKLTKRHQQIIAAIEEIGRPCTPYDLRPKLKEAGLDLSPKSIADSCKTLAAKGMLDYHRGDLRTLVLFGLPGMEIPEEVDRKVKRRASWGYGPGPGR